MPSATAIHAACFAVGAVVGGGIAAAVSARGVGRPRPASATASSTAVIPAVGPPIVEVGPTGDAKLIPSAAVSGALVSPVLKYGHPGGFSFLFFFTFQNCRDLGFTSRDTVEG
ncbi:hypothetical protein M404DRAFT_602542 [Pisolithus tinctorius Marx 270]|uniref:Uncharacterized protein n=1 Tax=Pisolithus tinctorius Marx 270 TaxID=870435 RepID=A0A0C3P999_PISTI|nr:hypothetical protein M404DRAFT_602542 [Pisolithus tinctorius Marx 270]